MRPARSILILTLPMLLAAQTPQSPAPKKPVNKEEEELLALLSIEIISVSKVAQRPIDAPGVVSALTRDQLRDYGWISLNDVMGKQPGFVPSQDYDRRTLSARGVFEGWNNNHILVLVDGVPMNDNFYGSAYTSEVTPLFMAKNLEIMRGPGSALYGSNAVNGVASVNTVKAEDIKGGGEARLRLGDRATRTLDFLTGFSDDRFSFVTAYSNLATNGNEYLSLDASGRTDANGNLQPFRTRDNRRNDYFFAKLEGLFALEGWSLQFHQQRWSFGTGHGWLFYIPDQFESMNEERQIAVLKYAKENDGLTQEYVLRYQVHRIDWNQRYYPDGTTDAYATFYPSGLTEYLNTSADELFARAQLTWKFGGDGSVVAGFEGNRFGYDGDKDHRSNVDINTGGTFVPTADGHFLPLRGFLEWTQGHPVLRTALYAQFASGKLAGGHFSATAGVRYDKQSSDFNALDKATAPGVYPIETLSYSQVSPRLGLLFHGSENYTLKLLVGRAFRTPAPSETFGANTYALASNIRNLQAEVADTVELASDWIINKNFNWRINLYQAKLKNLIGYSLNANLSNNLFTPTTRGVETELLWGSGPWSGFVNVSHFQRQKEEILDSTIVERKDITWMPSTTANLGVAFKKGAFSASAAAHHQGVALRRSNELGLEPYRPDEVASWNSVDFRFAFRPAKGLELEIGASNAFDTKGYLAKNFANPFDYRIDPRMVWVGLRLN
jgi:iron complex outermembrane receptor protein